MGVRNKITVVGAGNVGATAAHWLAAKELGESRDLVSSFLRERVNPDGGFQDRAGASDLYYTVFGLDALIALQEPLPIDETAVYLNRFGDGVNLDLVHLACLARAWAAGPTRRTELA